MKRPRPRPTWERAEPKAWIARLERALAFSLVACVASFYVLGEKSIYLEQQMAASLRLPIADGLSAVLGILALIVLNALFTGAATAVELLRPVHIKLLRDQENVRASRLQEFLDRKPQIVAAENLGNQACRLLLIFMGMLLAPGLVAFGEVRLGWSFHYGSVLLAALAVVVPVGLLNLVAGELVPKSYASLHPVRVALLLRRFISITSLLLHFPAKLVVSIASVFTARFGGQASFEVVNQAEQEIKTLVESAEETGEIESDEKELLHSVFEFTDTVAREVMTPRVDLDAMPVRSDPAEVVRVIQETGHSRIPLYEDTDDQIIGIIHAKDLLMAMIHQPERANLRRLMRPALFVPENKNLQDLLTEMRASRNQMAVVQDEFGGTAGIVTIEDIVEELVGDIVDEYDQEEPEIVSDEAGWSVDGKTHVDDLNRELGADLESDEFDTIGGYVFGLFGRQPRHGETIESEGYLFTVIETDGRRVQRLRISKLDENASSAL